jgi:TRAP-type C4-dicarboxylate transport system permease small subunit
MTFITVINVISRKFLGMSMSFLEEITIAMFILISLFGAAEVAKEGGHLGLNLLTDMMPKKAQKVTSVISWACAMFFGGLLVRYGYVMVKGEIALGMTTPSLGWPEWWFGAIIPLSGLFIIIRFTQWIINILMDKDTKGSGEVK